MLISVEAISSLETSRPRPFAATPPQESDPSMRDRKKQRCVRMTRVDGRDFRSTSEMRAVAVPITERYSVIHECMGSMIHPLPIHHA